MKVSWGAVLLLTSAGLAVFTAGCADENPNDPVAARPPGPGGPPPGPVAAPSNPKLKEIMAAIGRGPQSLQETLKSALKAGDPAWDTIQGKTKEYARLAGEMSAHEPTKGSKDSWAKLTASFSKAASELDLAAQAKDKDKTASALDGLGSSCMACHREHRTMGPPGGGPPGGFRGGPPGGFGGGPPGGFRPPPGGEAAKTPPPAPAKPAGGADAK